MRSNRIYSCFSFALFGSLLVLAISGCNRSETNTSSQSPAEPIAIEPIGDRVESWRTLATREAMKGLDYSSGRVQLNNADAAEKSSGPGIDSAEKSHARGVELYNEGRIIEALERLTLAVILDSRNADYLRDLSRALAFKQKPDKALAAVQSSLDIEPDSVESLELQGMLEAALQLREDAIKTFQRLIVLDPNNSAARLRLAMLHYYSGDLAAARDEAAIVEQVGAPVPPQFAELLAGNQLRTDIRSFADRKETGLTPSIGLQTRVDVTNSGTANETTAVSSEFDSGVVVTGWNDYRGLIRSGFSISTDGGDSWQDSVIRPPAQFQNTTEGDPMTCADSRTGDIWVGAISFGSEGGVYVARLNQGDTSFQPTVMASTLGTADKCWMAAGPRPGEPDSTRLYVGYNRGLLTSDDRGDTWSGPDAFPETGIGFLPRIGPGGELYVSYWDFPDEFCLVRSFDGGKTFGSPITIANRMDPWIFDGTRFPGRFRVAPLANLAVDPNSGVLYAAWADTTEVVSGNSNVDIYFSRSLDQGTTWSSPAIINSDSEISGDQFFPWMEVDSSGRLHLLFYDTRSVAQNDGASAPPATIEAWYSYSDDGGESWTETVLSPPFSSGDIGISPEFIGDYLGMAVSGTTVWPCYLSTQEGIGDIYVHRIEHSLLLGDVNRDGSVDLEDIPAFVEVLASGNFDKAADIDGDGFVSLSDIPLFVDLLSG